MMVIRRATLMIALGTRGQSVVEQAWNEAAKLSAKDVVGNCALAVVRISEEAVPPVGGMPAVRIDYGRVLKAASLKGSLGEVTDLHLRESLSYLDTVSLASPGGRRALGRLAFFHFEHNIRYEIDKSIRQLGQGDFSRQIEVVIVVDARSASGTGMLWDVACILARYGQIVSLAVMLIVPGSRAPELISEVDRGNIFAVLLEALCFRLGTMESAGVGLRGGDRWPFEGLFSRFYLLEDSTSLGEVSSDAIRAVVGKLFTPFAATDFQQGERLRETELGDALSRRRGYPFSTMSVARVYLGGDEISADADAQSTSIDEALNSLSSSAYGKLEGSETASVRERLARWRLRVEDSADDLARAIRGWLENLAHRTRWDESAPEGGFRHLCGVLGFLWRFSHNADQLVTEADTWLTLGPWDRFNELNCSLLSECFQSSERQELHNLLEISLRDGLPEGYRDRFGGWTPDNLWRRILHFFAHRQYFDLLVDLFLRLLGAEKDNCNGNDDLLARNFTVTLIAARLLIGKIDPLRVTRRGSEGTRLENEKQLAGKGQTPETEEAKAVVTASSLRPGRPWEDQLINEVAKALQECLKSSGRVLAGSIGELKVVIALPADVLAFVSRERLLEVAQMLPGQRPFPVALVETADPRIWILLENLFHPLSVLEERIGPYAQTFFSLKERRLHVFDPRALSLGMFQRNPFKPLYCGNSGCREDISDIEPGVLACPRCDRRIRWRCGNPHCFFIFPDGDEKFRESRTCPSCYGFNNGGWWLCDRHGRVPVLIPIDKEYCPRCVREQLLAEEGEQDLCVSAVYARKRYCPNCLRINSSDGSRSVYEIPAEMERFFTDGVNGHGRAQFERLSSEHHWLGGTGCPVCHTPLIPIHLPA